MKVFTTKSRVYWVWAVGPTALAVAPGMPTWILVAGLLLTGIMIVIRVPPVAKAIVLTARVFAVARLVSDRKLSQENFLKLVKIVFGG